MIFLLKKVKMSLSKLLLAAGNASKKSDLSYKHGAVISTKDGNIVASGCNNSRTKHGSHINCSTHAEMDVIDAFSSRFLKGKNIQCLL